MIPNWKAKAVGSGGVDEEFFFLVSILFLIHSNFYMSSGSGTSPVKQTFFVFSLFREYGIYKELTANFCGCFVLERQAGNGGVRTDKMRRSGVFDDRRTMANKPDRQGWSNAQDWIKQDSKRQ